MNSIKEQTKISNVKKKKIISTVLSGPMPNSEESEESFEQNDDYVILEDDKFKNQFGGSNFYQSNIQRQNNKQNRHIFNSLQEGSSNIKPGMQSINYSEMNGNKNRNYSIGVIPSEQQQAYIKGQSKIQNTPQLQLQINQGQSNLNLKVPSLDQIGSIIDKKGRTYSEKLNPHPPELIGFQKQCEIQLHLMESIYKSQRERFQVKETSDIKEGRDTIGKKTINEYRFVKKIGEGSFAKVKLAISNKTSKQYAVKIMYKSQLQKKIYTVVNKEGKQVFRNSLDDLNREISIMKVIWHPNVIKLYEIIQNKSHDRIYLVLEYAQLGQLMNWSSSTQQFTRNDCFYKIMAHQQQNQISGTPSPNILQNCPQKYSPNILCASSPQIYHLKKNSADSEIQLQQEIDGESIDEAKLRMILRQCVKGLAYLHSNNIIHRDIKPQNILVSKCGMVKLSDFGISTIVGDEDENLQNQDGTYQFQPPEFFAKNKPASQSSHSNHFSFFSGSFSSLCKKSKSNISSEMMERIERICRLKQADVWALGVTLFALIYKKLPFYHRDLQQLFQLIEKCNLKFPSKPVISQGLQQLIKGLLEKDYEKRLTLDDIQQNSWVNQDQQDLQEEIILSQQRKLTPTSHQQSTEEVSFKYPTQQTKNNNSINQKPLSRKDRIKKAINYIKGIAYCKILFIRFRNNRTNTKQTSSKQKANASQKIQNPKQHYLNISQQSQQISKLEVPSNVSTKSSQQSNHFFDQLSSQSKQENNNFYSMTPESSYYQAKSGTILNQQGQTNNKEQNEKNRKLGTPSNNEQIFVRSNISHNSSPPTFLNQHAKKIQYDLNDNFNLNDRGSNNKVYDLPNIDEIQIKKTQSQMSRASINEDSLLEESEIANIIPSLKQKQIKLKSDIDIDFLSDKNGNSPMKQFESINLKHQPKSENIKFQKLSKVNTDTIPFSDENLQNSTDLDVINTIITSSNEKKGNIRIPYFATSSLVQKLD